jgi:hypothetical protein
MPDLFHLVEWGGTLRQDRAVKNYNDSDSSQFPKNKLNTSIRIAFWSEWKGSGTTAGLLAIAGMYAIRHPESRIMVRSVDMEKAISKGGYGRYRIPEETADVIFLDCGNSRSRECFQVLRSMELVVVNLCQEQQCLNRFFFEDIHQLSDAMILLGNYYASEPCDNSYLEYMYRICSTRIGVIPANAEFSSAYAQGKVRRFIRQEYQNSRSERNDRLLEELERFTRKIELTLDHKIQTA